MGRGKHCLSGVSHVYELNRLHFTDKENVKLEVLKFFNSKEGALSCEKDLIVKLKPKLNKVYNVCTRGEQAIQSKQVKLNLNSYVDGVVWDTKQKVKCKELINEFWEFYPYIDIINGDIELLTKDLYRHHNKWRMLQLSRWLTSGDKKYSTTHYCNLFHQAYLSVYGVNIVALKSK